MYQTIKRRCDSEQVIQKSRFLTTAIPIGDEAEAKVFIESVRKAHWRATHCVPAYLLGNPYIVERYSDDGEPSGTAGLPILSMLKEQGITDICIVVVRYFGGIKLGKGGLVRAYTSSAQQVLSGQLIQVKPYARFDCRYAYHHHGKVEYLLNSRRAHLADTAFTESIALRFYININEAIEMAQALIEITAGDIVQTQALVSGYVDATGFVEIAVLEEPK